MKDYFTFELGECDNLIHGKPSKGGIECHFLFEGFLYSKYC